MLRNNNHKSSLHKSKRGTMLVLIAVGISKTSSLLVTSIINLLKRLKCSLAWSIISSPLHSKIKGTPILQSKLKFDKSVENSSRT